MKTLTSEQEKYVSKKLDEIEGWVVVAVGSANIIGMMTGKCTDGVIAGRDEATDKIKKIVRQIIKHL